MTVTTRNPTRALLAALVLSSLLGFAREAQAQPTSTTTVIDEQECPDRDGSRTSAQRARAAFRIGRYAESATIWTHAIATCALPDRYEGRGRVRETMQGRLPDGPERLALIQGALEDYRQALARQHLVEGFDSTAIDAAVRGLDEVRARLEAQLRPTPRPPACRNTQTDRLNCGRCGNECASGEDCVAGACQPGLTGRPPTRPSRLAPWLMVASGAVIAAASATILGYGLSARADADTYDPQLCEVTVGTPTCRRYLPGDTRPADVAAWAVPLGAVGIGLGAIDLAIGAIWLATSHGRPSHEGPRLTGYATTQGGILAMNIPF